MNKRGVHGEKLVSLLKSAKLPETDRPAVEKTLELYDSWVKDLETLSTKSSTRETITKAVQLLNDYKFAVEFDLIFDSKNNFLYRQKGQLKLDNTIIEEFLPILVKKCLNDEISKLNVNIESQEKVFSSLHFTAALHTPGIGSGLEIKSKDQDFSISRKLFLRSSYDSKFDPSQTQTVVTSLGYVLAELKTNLDKTMFQEAAATARDVKLAVTGARYFLLCDFLDMTPISSQTTDTRRRTYVSHKNHSRPQKQGRRPRPFKACALSRKHRKRLPGAETKTPLARGSRPLSYAPFDSK